MQVALLEMVGQAADVTSLMGMTLMKEPTLVLRTRRRMVTTHPPLHSQVSTVNLCMCMFMCVWAVSVSVLL